MGNATEVRGMSKQKVLATVQMLRMDENLGGAILVALGTLFMLLSFSFYPIYLVPLLAIATGWLAYRQPPLGTIASMLLAFPAVAYQAPVLAWVFTLAVAVTLFEAFEHWSTISFLQIAILAPFAPFPFSLLSGFLYLLLGIAAFRFGSRHSFAVSLPAIFIVLLLSTLWLMPNSSFITISSSYSSMYGPAMDELSANSKPASGIAELVPSAGSAFLSLASIDNVRVVSPALGKLAENTFILLTRDAAIPQLASWAAALFLCAFLPARFDHKYKQTISSLSLFIVPVVNLLAGPAFGNPASPYSFAYCAASVGVIAAMEHYGLSLSREREVMRSDMQKAFTKFGETELKGPSEKLADIGGYEDVKTELREAIITPIKKPEYAYAYKLKPPKGILLFGPPGTGKTMMMRAVANELDVGFRYVKCSEILSEWYGESEKNLAEIFKIARNKAPFLVFFDEIDAIGKRRDSYTSDDVAPRIMSVLLQELDGFQQQGKKNVIFVGATNIPDQLDPALMRPGRFDKIIYMHLPDAEARKAIFKVHLRGLPADKDIDFDKLAAVTERYSGADIKNICTEASRLAVREAMAGEVVVNVSMKHLTTTLKKLKPSVSLDQLENYGKFRMDYERRSEAEEKKPDEKGVRWEDVAGLAQVKQVLLESIEMPLLHEKEMKEAGVEPSKGLLLFGPPGCGKTMIVKAAANELKVNFLTISGSELMRGKDRSPAAFVKETFNRGRESAPALIFIDEIEALAPSRDEYRGGILTELLQEMDGVKELKNVMIIGATNKPFALDPAILRPGRFDKIIYIPPPDEPARIQLFTANLAKFLDKLDLKKLAGATEGYTGADLASICQEVKMQVVRDRLKGKPSPIATETVLKVASGRRPSVTQKDLREYFSFMQEYGERK